MFLIKGTETIPCPICGGHLLQRDRRKRCVIDQEDTKLVFSLRRLFCDRCKRLHTELPDFIIPYKRYGSKVIESLVTDDEGTIPYEGRTRQKIKSWYEKILGHLKGVWRQQVSLGFVSPDLSPTLVNLVRAAVNSGMWINHPFGRVSYSL